MRIYKSACLVILKMQRNLLAYANKFTINFQIQLIDSTPDKKLYYVLAIVII